MLPALNEFIDCTRNGRSPYEGTQRGFGIQHGLIKEKIFEDQLFREAYEVSNSRTIVTIENRINIYLILKYFLFKTPFGHIIEFGSYQGGMAIFMAYVVKNLYPGMKVYALDTFEGMPPTDKAIDYHDAGDFNAVNLDELRDFASSLDLSNLYFVKGAFVDTSPHILRSLGQISLAHIDCDIASSVQYSYESVLSYMVPGGYLIFDDALVSSCMGATEVVENLVIRRDCLNSEQIYPHAVFRAPGLRV